MSNSWPSRVKVSQRPPGRGVFLEDSDMQAAPGEMRRGGDPADPGAYDNNIADDFMIFLPTLQNGCEVAISGRRPLNASPSTDQPVRSARRRVV